MANGDMRDGRCGVCGRDEVYQGEYTAQGGLRQRGAMFAKTTVFDAFVCGACGHTQLHLQVGSSVLSHVQRKFERVPPRQGMGQ
ncbi:hypothetical protein [Streptomyces sp. B6B3]|uniref:hypothetical protein n=1 Tax=Streptomyces sp. B6B3 TaxID=3153570 RepID=UPI00325DF32F